MLVLPVHFFLARLSGLGLALGLGLTIFLPCLAQAGQASMAFQVRVAGAAAPAPARVFCTSLTGTGIFAATITVVCATGAVVGMTEPQGFTTLPVNGGASRYLVQVTRGAQQIGTIDAQTGPGTITGWQVVRLASQEYIELTLGW